VELDLQCSKTRMVKETLHLEGLVVCMA
jgi:hypothetical protein